MAQVPYSPVPDVTAQDRPTPSIHVDTPPAAFGGDIAKAVSTLGQVSEQVGGEIFQRAVALQQLHNESDARTATAQYMIEAGKLHADFSSLQGAAAGPEAFNNYTKALSDKRMEIRQSLSNPMAQKLYDADSFSTMGRTIFNGAGHSAEQMKQYSLGASKSLEDTANNQVSQNPRDERGYQAGLATAEHQARWRAAAMGRDANETEQDVAVAKSNLTASRILGFARDGDAITAQKLLNEAREKNLLFGKDIDKVQEAVDKSLYTNGSKLISNQVNTEMPNATPSQKVAAARAQAAKLAPDKPLLPDYAQAAVETQQASDERLAKQDAQVTMNTINDTILKSSMAGNPITDVESLKKASPEAAAAIDKLDPTEQLKLQLKLKEAQKTDNTPSPERESTMARLSGMAYGDPDKFKDIDLWGQNIRAEDRQVLLSKQKEILGGKRLDDPQLTSALRDPDIRYQLHAAGITDTKSDQYLQFSGALGDEINQYRLAGKTLSNTDIRGMAVRLLQDHATPGTWFGNAWQNHEHIFEAEPPEAAKAKITSDFQQRYGRVPLPMEIQRAYTRQLFNESLGAKAQ